MSELLVCTLERKGVREKKEKMETVLQKTKLEN